MPETDNTSHGALDDMFAHFNPDNSQDSLFIQHEFADSLREPLETQHNFDYVIDEEVAKSSWGENGTEELQKFFRDTLHIEQLVSAQEQVTGISGNPHFSGQPTTISPNCDAQFGDGSIDTSTTYTFKELPDGHRKVSQVFHKTENRINLTIGKNQPHMIHRRQSQFVHEKMHHQSPNIPCNVYLMEACAELGKGLTADRLGAHWENVHYSHSPNTLYSCGDAEALNLGDGMGFDMDLGGMKKEIECVGGNHLWNWLDKDAANFRIFMQTCLSSGPSGKSYTSSEFIEELDRKIPGFKDRYEADATSKTADDCIRIKSFPDTKDGKQTGVSIAAYAFKRNKNSGMTKKPFTRGAHIAVEDFDFSPGEVFPIPITVETVCETTQKRTTLQYRNAGHYKPNIAKLKTPGPFQMRLSLLGLNTLPAEIRQQFDVKRIDESEQWVDLGTFHKEPYTNV